MNEIIIILIPMILVGIIAYILTRPRDGNQEEIIKVPAMPTDPKKRMLYKIGVLFMICGLLGCMFVFQNATSGNTSSLPVGVTKIAILLLGIGIAQLILSRKK